MALNIPTHYPTRVFTLQRMDEHGEPKAATIAATDHPHGWELRKKSGQNFHLVGQHPFPDIHSLIRYAVNRFETDGYVS